MIEIICAAIAASATVIAAVAANRTRVASKRAEQRAERRAKETRLSMELMYANCSLSLITAKKLSGMHTNGDVEAAMEAATTAQEAYMDFARDEAAKNFAKV